MEEALRTLSAIENDYFNQYSMIPWLLDTYPFPLLITNALLRICQWFKKGPNSFRLALHNHVLSKIKGHLKLVNEECVKRITFVLNSNDPITRAICLRVIGLMAEHLKDNHLIHFKIQESLDGGENELEMEAAIFALKSLIRYSGDFNVMMQPFLLEKITLISTCKDVRIKLISCLSHNLGRIDSNSENVFNAVKGFMTGSDPEYINASCNVLLSFLKAGILATPPEMISIILPLITESRDLELQVIGWRAVSEVALAGYFSVDNFGVLFDALKNATSSKVITAATKTLLSMSKIESFVITIQKDLNFLFDHFACLLMYEASGNESLILNAIGVLAQLCMEIIMHEADERYKAMALLVPSFYRLGLRRFSSKSNTRKIERCLLSYFLKVASISPTSFPFIDSLNLSIVKDQSDKASLILELVYKILKLGMVPTSVKSQICQFCMDNLKSIGEDEPEDKIVSLIKLTLLAEDNSVDDKGRFEVLLLSAASKNRSWLIYRLGRLFLTQGSLQCANRAFDILNQTKKVGLKKKMESWIKALADYSSILCTLFFTQRQSIEAGVAGVLSLLSDALRGFQGILSDISLHHETFTFKYQFISLEYEIFSLFRDSLAELQFLSLNPDDLDMSSLVERSDALLQSYERFYRGHFGIDDNSSKILLIKFEAIILLNNFLKIGSSPSGSVPMKSPFLCKGIQYAELRNRLDSLAASGKIDELSACTFLLDLFCTMSSVKKVPMYFFKGSPVISLKLALPEQTRSYFKLKSSNEDVIIKIGGLLSVKPGFEKSLKEIQLLVYFTDPIYSVISFNPLIYPLPESPDLLLSVPIEDFYFEACCAVSQASLRLSDSLFKNIQVHLRLVDKNYNHWYFPAEHSVLNIQPTIEEK